MKYLIIWQDNNLVEGRIDYKTFETIDEMSTFYNDLIKEYADSKSPDLEFLFAGEISKEFDLKITEVIKKVELVEKYNKYISM